MTEFEKWKRDMHGEDIGSILDEDPLQSLSIKDANTRIQKEAFKAGQHHPEWVPVTERLPKTSKDYLVKTLTKDNVFIVEKIFYDVHAKHFMIFLPDRQYIA